MIMSWPWMANALAVTFKCQNTEVTRYKHKTKTSLRKTQNVTIRLPDWSMSLETLKCNSESK